MFRARHARATNEPTQEDDWLSDFFRLFDLLANPLFVLPGSVVLVLFAWAFSTQRLRPYSIGFVVFVSTAAPNTDFFGRWIQPAKPFDLLALHGRSATAVLLVVSAAIALLARPTRQLQRMPRLATALLVLQLALSLRQALGANFAEGISRGLIFFLIYATFGRAVYSHLVTVVDVQAVCRAIASALLLYVATTLGLMLVGYGSALEGSRWFGITGNPNHNAMVIALMLPAVLGLAVTSTEPKKWRIVWYTTAAASMLPLLLSGSRGGVLTAAVGVITLFRVKLGGLIVAIVPIVLGVFLTAQWFGGGDNGNPLRRFKFNTSNNTRQHVWQGMIDDWLQNPFLGSAGAFGVAENAYLGVLQRLGLVGLCIMLVAGGMFLHAAYHAQRHRRMLGPWEIYSHVATAGVMAILANSMFEATFFSNMNQTVFVLYLYLVMIEACARTDPPLAAPSSLN